MDSEQKFEDRKECEEVERLQERYIKWVLEVYERTPRYMVREKGKKEKLRTKIGRRAIRYKKRLEKDGGSKWGKKMFRRDQEERRNEWLGVEGTKEVFIKKEKDQ